MDEHARTVDAAPVEGAVREHVGLVPGEFDGVEPVHAALLEDLREIARGELCFFRAQAESCIQCVEKYQTSEDPMLRLSADMLSTFANFTLGNAKEAQMAREDVSQILKEHLKKEDPDMIASCLFAVYVTSVLIHIPPEKEMPLLSDYLRYLPEGQRLFAMNLLTPVEFSIAMLACRDWTNKCQFSENRR